MNFKQKTIVEHIKKLLEEKQSGKLLNGCVCIDGPGGSGKTYTYETLCHYFRSEDVKYKTSSWMGIAANLLPDGRTMHKTFGLPFGEIDKESTSSAKHNNKLGQELKDTEVFIIDEISMVSKHVLELIDRKMQELMENKLPFGGKIMIIGGDFRQILPIKKHGSRNQSVNLCVKFSYLWKHFARNIFRLTENKRALQNPTTKGQTDFADFILKMGNGELPVEEKDLIEIPNHCMAKKPLLDELFGELIEKGDFKAMSKRVILASTNERVKEINNKVLTRLELKGHKMTTFVSFDKVDEDQPKGYIEYTDEVLHSLEEAGLPPHLLRLTEGCPVMLLRNLNPAAGMSNGTRMIVKKMHKFLIECELTTGDKAGDTVYIPKISLTSKELPFTLFRKQFPIKPCFAMTINKSQGQIIDFVGIDLTETVFSHGQTYVAFSRARSWDSIRVETKAENKVVNIVWKEVLLDN
jgi:hypothetical protein